MHPFFRLIGLLLIAQGAALLFCLIPAIHFHDGTAQQILFAGLLIIGIGTFIATLNLTYDRFLTARFSRNRYIAKLQSAIVTSSKKRANTPGYLTVLLVWFTLVLFGSLPFLMTKVVPSFCDAFFESMSGFTTTGATIFSSVQHLPASILLWRSISQWVGGFGIVLLVLAVTPSLGINKYSLYTAEASMADNSGHNFSTTATTLRQTLTVYVLLTLLFILLFLGSGMNLWDAVNITFSNISSGGFSIYDNSAAALTPIQQLILTATMFCSGINFALIFNLFTFRWRQSRGKLEQFRCYIFILAVASAFVSFALHYTQHIPLTNAFRLGLAQTTSVLTTTGTIFADTSLWWQPITFLFLFLSLCGGMAGSTSGGIKIMRLIILIRNVRNDLQRRLHPNAIHPVRLNGKPVPQPLIDNVMVIFIIYAITLIVGVLCLMLCDVGATQAVGAVVSCLSGYGPGLGPSGGFGNYAHFPAIAKWFCSLIMIAGRLECITLIIVLFPQFYKKR